MNNRFRMRISLVTSLVIGLMLLSGMHNAGIRAAVCVQNPVVINNADSGAGSLRQAILDACDGNTITFANTVLSPITLVSELAIDKNLTIQGPGANLLAISGNNTVRVFNVGSVTSAINVRLSGLTIGNGRATDSSAGGPNGGGIFNNSAGTLSVTNTIISGNSALSASNAEGGGISNNSTGIVKVTNTTISGNRASGASLSLGGGFFNKSPGEMNVHNSAITGNFATGGNANFGGGISNASDMLVANSTIWGNTTAGGSVNRGGGISNAGGLQLTNSTISGNGAAGGSISTGTDGGGIYNAGSTNLKATIIALNSVSGPNSSGPDVYAGFSSEGYNLVGKSDGSVGFTNGVNNDQVGSIASPLDPKLGPLQDNGGPTSTMALLAGSPAIDAGDDSVLGSPWFLSTDQRGPGFPRVSGSHVDIGAFEQQYDACLEDNSSENHLQWNSTTGFYTFTRCSDGFTLTGTGTVALVNGIRTLRDFKSDRRISAGFNTGQLTGSATIYLQVAQGVWQTSRIVATNPSAICSCGL